MGEAAFDNTGWGEVFHQEGVYKEFNISTKVSRVNVAADPRWKMKFFEKYKRDGWWGKQNKWFGALRPGNVLADHPPSYRRMSCWGKLRYWTKTRLRWLYWREGQIVIHVAKVKEKHKGLIAWIHTNTIDGEKIAKTLQNTKAQRNHKRQIANDSDCMIKTSLHSY